MERIQTWLFIFHYFIAFDNLSEFKPVIQAAQITVGVNNFTHKLQMTSVISEPPQLDNRGSVFSFSLSFSLILWKSQLMGFILKLSLKQLSGIRCPQWGAAWDAARVFPTSTEDSNPCAFIFCWGTWTNHRLGTFHRLKSNILLFEKRQTHSTISPDVTIAGCDLQWAPLPKLLIKSHSEPLNEQQIFTVVWAQF